MNWAEKFAGRKCARVAGARQFHSQRWRGDSGGMLELIELIKAKGGGPKRGIELETEVQIVGEPG